MKRSYDSFTSSNEYFGYAYSVLVQAATVKAHKMSLGEEFVDYVLETRLMKIRQLCFRFESGEEAFKEFIVRVVSTNVRWAYYDFKKRQWVAARVLDHVTPDQPTAWDDQKSPFTIDVRDTLEKIYKLSRRPNKKGDHVRQLLEYSRGFTLDELAKKYGYKTRSSILKHTQMARLELQKAFKVTDPPLPRPLR